MIIPFYGGCSAAAAVCRWSRSSVCVSMHLYIHGYLQEKLVNNEMRRNVAINLMALVEEGDEESLPQTVPRSLCIVRGLG